MHQILCRTTASELRRQLRQWSGRLYVELSVEGVDVSYRDDVTVDLVAPQSEGALQVACTARNEVAFTLSLEAAGDSETVSVAAGEQAALQLSRFSVQKCAAPLDVDALEEFMRWREACIIWGHPEPADDGPYARHPRLHLLSRDVREQIAAALANGKLIAAIKCLKEGAPAMGLKDAKVCIDALRLHWES